MMVGSAYIESLLAADYVQPQVLMVLWALPVLAVLALVRAPRLWLMHLLRLSALALLLVALADPVTTQRTATEELTGLVDLSYSVSKRAQEGFAQELATFLRGRDSSLELYPFARQTMQRPFTVTSAMSADAISRLLENAREDLDTGDTNIGLALTNALSLTESSSILLLSDGMETTGDALHAARASAKKGVRVFPLLPDVSLFSREKLAISSLTAPITAHAGDKAAVRVSVQNSHGEALRGTVEVWLENKKLFSQLLGFPANQEKLITLESTALEGGLHRLRAVLIPEGGNHAAPEEKHRWISVKEKEKILMVSGSKEDERVIKDLIGLKGYGLTNLVADGNATIPVSFEPYASVVLNNAAREQLPGGFLPALQRFVAQGGGLLLLGGERAYGLGNYIDTPLEELSPLKFVPPQTKRRRLTVAVILVIDKSGSMAHQNKIDAAKAAARQSVDALKDEDFVGVIGFDHAPFVIIPLKSVREVRDQAERRLRNLTAAGRTNLLPAMAAARQSLANNPASRKHIIVLSDGKIPLSSDVYVEEINRLRSDGVSVSTVALGLEADVPFLKLLSKYGKGAFYHTLDPSRLPQIFVHDIKVSTGEETMKENQEFPVGVGPSGVVTTSITRYPPLRGFVETLPKKGADLELVTRKGTKVHPILASWKYKLGRVIAYTSDANGRWSIPWLRWPKFPEFWGDVTEAIKDRSGTRTNEVDFDLRYRVNRGAVLLDLAIFDERLRSQSSPQITAQVLEPGGEPKQIAFRVVKKGRFEAAIENGRPGDYKITIAYGELQLPPVAITLGGEAFGESPGRGVNLATLEQIAYVSGGVLNPTHDQVQGHERVSEETEHLLTPLVLLALLLVLFDVFLREVGLPRFRRNVGRTDDGVSNKSQPNKPQGRYGPGEANAA
ncbi:MAG: VWA domain-containing protein [Bdellovibrionales bacterium]|nr:VWA domain-containing protein [Bdellovibrionales bacterium]